MFGSQMKKIVSDPKTMWNMFYTSVMIFGAFHLTKLSLAIAGAKIMSRFGKP